MPSIENSLKHEDATPAGTVRLIASGDFVRAYNRSAWRFHSCISQYKVIRKYSKAQQKDIYFLGFPASKLLELIDGRICEKTDFGYDIKLKEGEAPAEEGYEIWTKEVPVENCRVIGNRREWERLPKEKSLFHSKPGCGLPIGNLSSQLFSNVYLGALDDFAKRVLKCRHYGRYVDDAYAVGKSREELWALVSRIREFLREELALELNEKKVRVTDAYRGVEFLGAFVKPYRTYPAARTLRRIRGRMRSLDRSEEPRRIQARVNSMLGTLGHFDCFQTRKVLIWKAGLRECGHFSGDWLRFRPDRLKFRRFPSKRNGGIR